MNRSSTMPSNGSSPSDRKLKEELEGLTGFAIPEQRWRDIAPTLQTLREAGASRAELVARVTVAKTRFFRDEPVFEVLARELLPALPESLALWSAGCSTGEELLSLALLCWERRGSLRGVELLGTDLNLHSLERARRGCYQRERLAEIPARFHGHLELDGEFFKGPRALRERLRFEAHNLVLEPYPRPRVGLWDGILCRNVLIYLAPEKQREVLERCFEVLAPGGFLLTGAAETLLEHRDLFRVELREAMYFFRRA